MIISIFLSIFINEHIKLKLKAKLITIPQLVKRGSFKFEKVNPNVMLILYN